MTSSDGPTDELVDRLRRSVSAVLDDWAAGRDAVVEEGRRETKAFARPLAAPPVRMEQLARTPEPTADLDDLVDLLVPRLVEQLVPALRAALRDDA